MKQKIILDKINQLLKSKGFTDDSIKSYTRCIARFTDKLGNKFEHKDIKKEFEKSEYAPRTHNNYKTIMNFFCKEYLNFEIKFSKAKVPESLPTYVSKEDMFRILVTIPNRKHKLWYGLMYGSGLRVSEVAKLKKHNVYPERFAIFVEAGKGKKDRWTLMRPRLSNVITKYIKESDENNPYMFPTYRGHISIRSIQERLKKAIIDAKLHKKFGCHDLRHSFAINFLDKLNDIDILKELLGHKKITTTQIYSKCRTINITQLAERV